MYRTWLFTVVVLFATFSAAAQNYALNFDGSDDYVEITDADPLDLTTNYTLEAWVFARSLEDNEGIISKYHNSDNGYSLRVMANGALNFDGMTTAASTITTGQWVHIAAVNSGGTRTLYVNGVSQSLSGTATSISANTDPVRIGQHDNAYYFDGWIDEARIWSTARTATDIRKNMYRTPFSTTNLVAYYKMSDGSGTSLTDNSGNGRTGTLTNDPTWVASGAFAGPRNVLDFDGSNEYIAFDSSVPPSSTTTTLEAWIKITDTSREEIVGWGHTTRHDVVEFRVQSAKLEFGIDDGLGWSVVTGQTTLATNVWAHVVAVKSGTSITLYVNGVQDATGTITRSAIVDRMRIGGLLKDGYMWAGYYFSGQIDEVRIWNTVRTADQIRENMFRTLDGDEAGLVAYYRFDQVNASDQTTLYNLTGDSYHGTLTNMEAASDWVSSDAFNTWIGCQSSDCSVAANWSRCSVPGSGANVGIYKCTLANDAVLSSSMTLNNLLIASCASPTLSAGFTVNGHFILCKDTDLNGQAITLGSNGRLVEGSNRLYCSAGTGTIATTRNLNNITNENVGGLGAQITTSANMGSTTITRLHHKFNHAINRYFDIHPTNNSGLNATLVFHYLDSELNGKNETALKAFKSTDGGETWSDQGGTVDTEANTVTVTGIGSFSQWTLSDENPIAVSLLAFSAVRRNRSALIEWRVDNTIGIAGFRVRKSNSPHGPFLPLHDGLITTGENSVEPRNFSVIDPSCDSQAWYQLQIVMLDGSVHNSSAAPLSESAAVASQPLPSAFALHPNFPNPFNPSTAVAFDLPQDEYVSLNVYDLKGRLVASLVDGHCPAGRHNVLWNGNDQYGAPMPSGIYLCKITAGTFSASRRMLLMK